MLPLELTIYLENDDSLTDPRSASLGKDPRNEAIITRIAEGSQLGLRSLSEVRHGRRSRP